MNQKLYKWNQKIPLTLYTTIKNCLHPGIFADPFFWLSCQAEHIIEPSSPHITEKPCSLITAAEVSGTTIRVNGIKHYVARFDVLSCCCMFSTPQLLIFKSAASAFWPSAVLGCPVKLSSQGVTQLFFILFYSGVCVDGVKAKGFSLCKRFYGRANDAYYKVYHPRKLQQDRFAEYKRESLLWVPCWVLATGSPISLWAALSANVVGSRQAGCCLFYECHIKHTHKKSSGTPIKM